MERKETKSVIDRVRDVMPIGMLLQVTRSLSPAEARVIAERQANMLLRLLGISKPSVDIELVAELPDVRVEFLRDQNYSGQTRWMGDHWHIYINEDDSLWRCRSTLAHELKHILDDPYIEVLYEDSPRSKEAESVCDYFAGCVLVPRAWVKAAWRRGARDLTTLASIFNVSESMMLTRLRQIGLEPSPDDCGNSTRRNFIKKAADGLLGNQGRLPVPDTY